MLSVMFFSHRTKGGARFLLCVYGTDVYGSVLSKCFAISSDCCGVADVLPTVVESSCAMFDVYRQENREFCSRRSLSSWSCHISSYISSHHAVAPSLLYGLQVLINTPPLEIDI